ncbi:MAG: SDR family oxidoreductase [Myxococcales bacterium]|nr:SDR family oxidoreductase [Myxococcales bacterium]
MSRPRAVVTGGAKRVGRAICLHLAQSGFDVAVHHRSGAEQAEEVAAQCRAAGADAFTVAADLAHTDQVQGLVSGVLERWDQISLLVNNASVYDPVPFEEIDAAEWDRVQAINTRAPFLLCRGFLSALRAADPSAIGAPAGQHGVVVHMCDIGADNPQVGYTHYSVSKAGLVMLVKTMALELAPAVRTVGISPGHVAWPPAYSDERRGRLASRIPLKRVGAPDDIARLVRFLTLEAHYVNGAIVPVDGGLGKRY